MPLGVIILNSLSGNQVSMFILEFSIFMFKSKYFNFNNVSCQLHGEPVIEEIHYVPCYMLQLCFSLLNIGPSGVRALPLGYKLIQKIQNECKNNMEHVLTYYWSSPSTFNTNMFPSCENCLHIFICKHIYCIQMYTLI